MKDVIVSKFLCLLSPFLAGLAHLCMFYIGWPIPYPIVGIAAVGAGIAGIVVSATINKKRGNHPIMTIYFLLAGLGILVGGFYASIVGPLIVFFPEI